MSDEFVNHLPLWFLKPSVLVYVELAEWLFRGRWNPKLRSSCFHRTSQMTRLSSSKTRAFIGEEFDGFLQTSVRLLTALHAFLHGILRTL